MALTKTEIEAEWHSVPKNWYAIYQWERTSRAGYMEWLSEWIEREFSTIYLVATGLRSRTFRVADHRGQINMNTEIEQITEKRIVRAMFNLGSIPGLGNVIDYEVPLKDNDASAHGDIDLLCSLEDACLCVEAKKPNSSESILKAILQAYVYTSLIATKKELFFSSFNLDQNLRLTPAILTFANAQSGRQLMGLKEYPNLLRLIAKINCQLTEIGIAPMRFFIVENSDVELAGCLATKTEMNSDVKVVFREGFALSIKEQIIVSQ